MMTPSEITDQLRQCFPQAHIEVKDTHGDHNHYTVFVRSALFKGKSRIEQHKMVYDALRGAVGRSVHAMSLRTEVDTL